LAYQEPCTYTSLINADIVYASSGIRTKDLRQHGSLVRFLRSKVLIAVIVDVKPCFLVDVYRYFTLYI
jgi:hypothetical protein